MVATLSHQRYCMAPAACYLDACLPSLLPEDPMTMHRAPTPLPDDEPFEEDVPQPIPQDEPVPDPNPE